VQEPLAFQPRLPGWNGNRPAQIFGTGVPIVSADGGKSLNIIFLLTTMGEEPVSKIVSQLAKHATGAKEEDLLKNHFLACDHGALTALP
jgi:hypothetical protein